MNKKIITLTTLSIIIVAVVACSNLSGKNETKSNTANLPANDSAAKVKRGEYLVNSIGCDDCHSPKRMGAHGPELIPELRLSGFPKDGRLPEVDKNALGKGWVLFAPDLTSAVGPWGISYAANLTSDQTGIGNWKEENFIRAIREGVSKGLTGNRPLLPPMPWPSLRKLTDEDLASIFAYLKTTKAVNNAVPAPVSFAPAK